MLMKSGSEYARGKPAKMTNTFNFSVFWVATMTMSLIKIVTGLNTSEEEIYK